MTKTSFVPAGLRSTLRSRVEPVARLFGRVGLTPNALTVIGLAIAVIAAFAAATQAWLAAGLLVAFGAAFDMFDGALARATSTTSRYGAFLDSTLDRAGEAVVYIGIAWGLGAPNIENLASGGQVLAMAAMAAAFMVSYTRSKSEGLGFSSGSGMASVGFAPREVRVTILVIGLVGTGLAGGVGTMFFPNPAGSTAMYGSLIAITVLATLTTIQRILFVYRQAQNETNKEVQE